jgi:hypothetical protein
VTAVRGYLRVMNALPYSALKIFAIQYWHLATWLVARVDERHFEVIWPHLAEVDDLDRVIVRVIEPGQNGQSADSSQVRHHKRSGFPVQQDRVLPRGHLRVEPDRVDRVLNGISLCGTPLAQVKILIAAIDALVIPAPANRRLAMRLCPCSSRSRLCPVFVSRAGSLHRRGSSRWDCASRAL